MEEKRELLDFIMKYKDKAIEWIEPISDEDFKKDLEETDIKELKKAVKLIAGKLITDEIAEKTRYIG